MDKIWNENDGRLSQLLFKMWRFVISWFVISCCLLAELRIMPKSLCAPGLSWDVMLKMSKIELELIPDPSMYIFFENGTRGGISYIANRYSKVNNKYLKSYDPHKHQNILCT